MVRAIETTLQELFEGSKQYQVPLYQRPYSWRGPQLARLWDDVVKLAQDRRNGSPALTHFIGSLVLAPGSNVGPAGVQEYLVVDGQQRLTTLSLLLCAIRDHRAEHEDVFHHDRVNEQYLINKWKQERHRLKMLPTQADRGAYAAVVDATPEAGDTSGVGAAYRYFRAQLASHDDEDDDEDIEVLEQAVIVGLALVSVTAQPGDNVHRIFESLNNTGLRLTQGDLVRNYIFMRLPTMGDDVYRTHWLPMQQRLSNDELELLFWLDLVSRDPRFKQSETYVGQQRRLEGIADEDGVAAEVGRFARLSVLLKIVLDPGHEPDRAVRDRLARLQRWGSTTAYPLLLHLMAQRERGEATSQQVADAMRYLESYFVRRIVIGRATANLNRVLLSAVPEMRSDLPVDEALRRYLSTGRKYFATDVQVRQSARVVPFYLNGRASQRHLILEWLEETYDSKEPVDLTQATIEHVLPQTPTSYWREAISRDMTPDETVDDVYESLLHTIGNLTLTGYNQKLGNSPFSSKTTQLRKSGIAMNQEIADQDAWGRSQILARADRLAERIIREWPGPIDVIEEPGGPAWSVMARALAQLPTGAWTTYGDVAALIGSHAVPVGVHLASHDIYNAHRVLQAEGTISPGFRWLDPSDTRDPRHVLEAEGVVFDELGCASPSQRLRTDELAQLVGIDMDETADMVDFPAGVNQEYAQSFADQLAEAHSADVVDGVFRLLQAWAGLGGQLEYGTHAETSCFLLRREAADPRGGRIWPLVIYPSGKVEVVFQHLARRPPFDDVNLREQLRQHLNTIPDVELAAAKLDLRPGFDVTVLGSATSRDRLIEALAWFVAVDRTSDQAELDRLLSPVTPTA